MRTHVDADDLRRLSLDTGDKTALTAMVTELERSWNTGDADGFGSLFTEDADFVHRFGGRVTGRVAIAEVHRSILSGPYARSTVRYTPTSLRLLAPGVALIHANAHLDAPRIAASLDALWSAVALRGPNGWAITSFHNTLVEPITI